MAEQIGALFPVLADPDGEVVRRFGVFDLLNDGVAAPATFIVDKDGTLLLEHVGQTIADRPSADSVLESLRTLKSAS